MTTSNAISTTTGLISIQNSATSNADWLFLHNMVSLSSMPIGRRFPNMYTRITNTRLIRLITGCTRFLLVRTSFLTSKSYTI